MRIRIAISDVEVEIDDANLTKRDVTKLLTQTATIALAIPSASEPAPAEANPVGFTAHLERAPDFQEQDLSWYFDDKVSE